MTACLFCKRDDVPLLPSTPIVADVRVSHVGPDGLPCLEGAEPEAHSVALAEFPHDELLHDPDLWDVGELAPIPAAPAPVITEPITVPAVKPKPVTLRRRKHATE